MNLLYDSFPMTVTVCGKEKRIVTDFRDWLRFTDMVRDPEVIAEDKFSLMLQYYLDDPSINGGIDVEWIQQPLLDFFKMKQAKNKTGETGDNPKPLFDFAFDAECIIADFFSAYRIDLLKVRYLHWWKFRILLDGLPAETEFKQRIMYRNTDIGQIKNKKERQRIQKIQRQIALPMPAPTDYEIGDLFW